MVINCNTTKLMKGMQEHDLPLFFKTLMARENLWTLQTN